MSFKALAAGRSREKTPVSGASGRRIYQDGAHPHRDEETGSEANSEEDPVALTNRNGDEDKTFADSAPKETSQCEQKC